jgi:transcriptional regulator with XRE-family HTH domain
VAAGQLLPATDRELLLTELRTELARRRRALGPSQARLAGRMGFDRTTVNKVERGAIEPSREFARQAERALEADGELWRRWTAFDAARRPRPPQGRQPARPVGPPPPSVVGHEQVDADQRRWVQVREGLNEHRLELSRLAARWHWRCQRIEGSDLLSRPEWLPACPVELGAVELVAAADPTPTPLTGVEPEAASARPPRSPQERYQRYSHALRQLDRPALFENRIGFRLLDVAFPAAGRGRLTFGTTTYFDAVDVCEAAAHELADRHLLLGAGGTALARPTTRPLPFRTLIGDPFDLARRPLLPSIDTLTIRRSRHGASFVLHQRDAAQVAVAGGMYHVMPAGVFQPSSVSLAGLASDFDLWRNVQREYSEEFLGRSKRRAHHQDHGIPKGDQVGRRGNAHASLDHDGTAGTPIDYREEPFRSMDAARRSGRVRVWCLGVGLDPLTLWGEILTVAVFDDEVFDELFSGLVVANDEGVVVTMATPGRPAHGVPFVAERVAQLLGSEPVAPAAAACLALAWRERERLLAT